MSAESFGGSWGNNVPSYGDEAWRQIMNEAREQMEGRSAQNEEAAETEADSAVTDELEGVVDSETVNSEVTSPEVVNVEFSSPRDDVALVERHQEDLEGRLAAENEVRMKQSEEEMGAFERKLEMSPEAYWQELKNEYALEGVNLGLMPDVRGMREYADGFLTENASGGDQTARIGMAIKTELDKMARSKAEEIRKWQSEGRGLPITFEGEWIEAGQKDMKNILNEYYGAEGEFGKRAGENGELTDEEKVAWQMAALPQKPGTLDPVYVVKSYAGRFEGETVPEYYNRLKNYRKQDQMRDWQIQQDQGKQVIDRGEEPVDEGVVGAGSDLEAQERMAAERREALEELGANPKSKVYALGNEAFVAEEPATGNMKVFVAEEDEAVKAERKAREVAEAIQETDAEVEQIWREREAKERAAMIEEVVKNRGFRMAVRRLVERFLDMMKLEDTTEEDEAYYAEMERQERQKKGFDAELWAATDTSGLPPVFEGEVNEGVTEEGAEDGERQEEVTTDIESVVRNLTPEKVQEVVATAKKAEEMLKRSDLSEATRESIEVQRSRLMAILERYREVEQERTKDREMTGELAFDYLVRKNLISGEMGESGARELETLKAETEKGLNEAAWDDDELAVNEYLERIKAIRRAAEWIGETSRAQRELDVIPVDRPQEVVESQEIVDEAGGAVA